MSRSQIRHDSEEGNVLSELLADLSSLAQWQVVHSWVNRNDNVRLERFDAFPDGLATRDGRMGIGPKLIQSIVGHVVENSPLAWVCRQVFVGIDERSIW